MKRVCELCGKPAKYKEFSPDGSPYYFCSEKHHVEFKNQEFKKGIVWRALPLEKLKL